ncbi:hypothetical protein GCM10009661_59130 [Catellatospora chokoriensis]|uniref:Uncharacterized protein n=1 Tax=Catellatospora chokoriensis TaxID=310353 RepID=A0A8J3K8R1_9ACTN|nr:hypothetical protein Cch02nite_61890 [Catellatospora chokoriensis]
MSTRTSGSRVRTWDMVATLSATGAAQACPRPDGGDTDSAAIRRTLCRWEICEAPTIWYGSTVR